MDIAGHPAWQYALGLLIILYLAVTLIRNHRRERAAAPPPPPRRAKSSRSAGHGPASNTENTGRAQAATAPPWSTTGPESTAPGPAYGQAYPGYGSPWPGSPPPPFPGQPQSGLDPLFPLFFMLQFKGYVMEERISFSGSLGFRFIKPKKKNDTIALSIDPPNMRVILKSETPEGDLGISELLKFLYPNGQIPPNIEPVLSTH